MTWILRTDPVPANLKGERKVMRLAELLTSRNGLKLLIGFLIAFTTGFLSAQTSATAQTCGSDYSIKEGESLADIAARVYGNASQWTLIFYANQDRMGANASLLVPGLSVRIPCLAGQQPSAAPVVQVTRQRNNFLLSPLRAMHRIVRCS